MLKISPFSYFKDKFFYNYITCISVSFVLLFFRWQTIPYLSARILLILDLLWFLIILLMNIMYQVKTLPNEVALYLNKEKFNKYIPKSKK
jgi:hypothetical protein